MLTSLRSVEPRQALPLTLPWTKSCVEIGVSALINDDDKHPSSKFRAIQYDQIERRGRSATRYLIQENQYSIMN